MPLFLVNLLAIGGWFFWLMVGLELIFSYLACKWEDGKQTGFATAVLIVLGAILGIHYWPLISWPILAGGVIGWFAVGTALSLYRWNKWCKQAREIYDKSRKTNREYHALIAECMKNEHKADLYRWILFWPVSALVHALSDVLDTIYDTFAGIYDKIAQSHIKDLQEPEVKPGANYD